MKLRTSGSGQNPLSCFKSEPIDCPSLCFFIVLAPVLKAFYK